MIFECSDGRLLNVALIHGRPRWLVLNDSALPQKGNQKIVRDDGKDVPVSGDRWERQRLVGVGILGDATIFAGRDQLIVASDGESPCLDVDCVDGQAAWAVNSRHLFRVANGRLVREDIFGPQLIGEVLPHQTRFWVGETFGFGYYRAGRLSVAFVFETSSVVLNDQVELPPLGGRWIDASCCFGADLCWLTVTADDGGRTVCHIVAIARDGTIKATRQVGAEKATGTHHACGRRHQPIWYRPTRASCVWT